MALTASEIVLISVILFLLVLLVAQQVFWQVQTNKLLAKLMSRNYAEYVQSENLKKPREKPDVREKKDLFEEDPVAAQQSQTINSMMGMI